MQAVFEFAEYVVVAKDGPTQGNMKMKARSLLKTLDFFR